jgi:hypothetical protein
VQHHMHNSSFAKLCITFAQQALQEHEITQRMLLAKAAMVVLTGQSELPWNANLVPEIAVTAVEH